MLLDEYDEMSPTCTPEEYEDIVNTSDNPQRKLLDKDLSAYFTKMCGKEDPGLIKSLINLANNPIYVRCDYDLEKASTEHPLYHMTVNFIEDSRFRIKSDFSFFDFVVFILDFVYGLKEEKPKQFISLARKTL